jgi:hypothetical protein
MNKETKNITEENYVIPVDVMLEVALIILQAEIGHEITAVKENKRQIVIGLSYQSDLKFHQEAIKNIDEILRSYHELCSEESDEVNWKD